MKRLIEKWANSYNPSLGGAIGIGIAAVIGTAVVAAPLAAGVGAFVAGSSGALWGAGMVAGGATAALAYLAGPQYMAYQCYKHVTRKKIENGQPLEKDWYFPGVRELKQQANAKREQTLKRNFDQRNTKPGQDNSDPSSQIPGKKPKPPSQ